MSESIYIEVINRADFYLSSPLPVEISLLRNLYVATWTETDIEGEGDTKEAAMASLVSECIEVYNKISEKFKSNSRVSRREEDLWDCLNYYFARAGSVSGMPGEALFEGQPGTKGYKGPVLG